MKTIKSELINDKLGYGYGSRYNLLRMLGWHRNFFNEEISKLTGVDKDINWLDFKQVGFDDKEIKNADFIEEFKDEWKKYWACGRGGINWDAVGKSNDGTYILIEAKGHLIEMGSEAKGKPESQTNNNNRIQEFLDSYNIQGITPEEICKECYQLINRLVFTKFLMDRGIKVKLVYVLFIDGFVNNRVVPDPTSKEQYQAEIEYELNYIKVKGTDAEKLVNILYIDCNN